MEEEVIVGPDIAVDTGPDVEADDAPCPAAETAADTEAAGEEAADARWPDVSSCLPGGGVWLYAVPVILLLFLWLFYPVILVLICIILALWWMG